MLKKHTDSICFVAADHTHLREILHPANDNVNTMFSLAHAYLEMGEESLRHRLVKCSETYYFLEGNGVMEMDGKAIPVEKEDTLYVPPNTVQSLRNTGTGKLVFLCIVSPPWSSTDEVILP